MKYYIFSFFISLLLIGCASTGEISKGTKENKASTSEVKVDNPSITLAQYLKRIPGIQVYGSGSNVQITVRNTTSVYGNTSPLFVIDGTAYGRNFDQVKNLVPVDMIDSVKVLKGANASSAYGMRGGSGVIVITTKKRNSGN